MALGTGPGADSHLKHAAQGKRGDRGHRQERRGPRQPRPLRPEEIPIKKQIDEESQAISNLHEQLAEVNKRIDASRRENDTGEKEEIKGRLDEIQGRINDLESKRSHCLGVIDMHQKEAREKTKSLNEMRQGVGYKNEVEVERLMQQLEKRMETTSMTLKEEKAMLQQLQQLRQAKVTLEMLEQSRQQNTGGDNTITSMKTQLDDLRAQMNNLHKIRKEEAQKLMAINENDRKHSGCMKGLYDERRQITAELKERNGNRAKLVQQLNEINDAYYAKQRLLQQQRMKKQQEERERRNLEFEIKQMRSQLDNLAFLPYEKEIRLLEQVMGYVNRLMAKDTAEVPKAEEPLVEDSSLKDAIEGTLVVPKKARDEYFIEPKQKSKNKTHKEKAKAGLKLDMVTIGYFESCGVTPPTSMNSLPDCLKSLEAKLAHFHDLRKDCDIDAMRAAQEDKLAAAEKKLEALLAQKISAKAPYGDPDAPEAENGVEAEVAAEVPVEAVEA
ncbi:nuclear segregation protein bfr1 like protein [Babesia gibsoni]|uniref:Nuclear segregation protein bfr1 like protein n=1 Tax=Babesia gibsoni TaxID=33632 RepID=A0AAD8LSI9_BABGI|nr:nuclear segregation protein bfr1 like protein [Babesia gibsoni]